MKIVKITSGIIGILLMLFVGLLFLQHRNIKNFMVEYWFPPKGKTINNYEIVWCNKSFINPLVAFVSDQVILDKYPESAIYFSKMENTFFGETNEDYLGATDVKNATFPELVKMVKEDCSQLQQGGRKGEMEWIYSPAPTQEWIDKDKTDHLKNGFYGFGEEAKKVFIQVYGDIETMTDKEKIELSDRIEGEGLDEKVGKARQAGLILEDLRYATESQREAVRARYGDWEELNTDELIKWAAEIEEAIASGTFDINNY